LNVFSISTLLSVLSIREKCSSIFLRRRVRSSKLDSVKNKFQNKFIFWPATMRIGMTRVVSPTVVQIWGGSQHCWFNNRLMGASDCVWRWKNERRSGKSRLVHSWSYSSQNFSLSKWFLKEFKIVFEEYISKLPPRLSRFSPLFFSSKFFSFFSFSPFKKVESNRVRKTRPVWNVLLYFLFNLDFLSSVPLHHKMHFTKTCLQLILVVLR